MLEINFKLLTLFTSLYVIASFAGSIGWLGRSIKRCVVHSIRPGLNCGMAGVFSSMTTWLYIHWGDTEQKVNPILPTVESILLFAISVGTAWGIGRYGIDKVATALGALLEIVQKVLDVVQKPWKKGGGQE